MKLLKGEESDGIMELYQTKLTFCWFCVKNPERVAIWCVIISK